MTDSFQGKVAVVIGCSDERGTGWAVAEALAAAGAKLVVGARNMKKLQVLADKIGGTAVRCDIANEEQVTEVADAAVRVYGGLDIAVNCAFTGTASMIVDVDRSVLQEAMEANFFGNVFFVQKMARAIGSDGSIIIMSAMSTLTPNAPLFPYAAGKAAADCLVRFAAIEYGPRNIRVNSVLPGPILTASIAEILAAPGAMAVFERETPLKRVGYPADFVNAILWLAGPAFVTGLNLPVCGGMQLARLPYFHEIPGLNQDDLPIVAKARGIVDGTAP